MTPRSAAETKLLRGILTQALAFVDASEDFAWSGMKGPELREAISSAIDALNNGDPIDVLQLPILFGPTGPLQDTSICNGWGEEYLSLSTEFDQAIEPWKK